jgi:hypothetical protein
MKNLRASGGPFAERPYFKPAEIEEICREALCAVDLYPTEPSPVRIDRFAEKRFGVHPIYEDLPKNLLGYTEFGANGVQRIVIARALDDEGSRTAERRISTTLAHEGGHGLLHAHLFALGVNASSLFGEGRDVRGPKIMCRDETLTSSVGSAPNKYDGRWWEFQANQAIGGLLMPRALVERCLAELVEEKGSFGRRLLDASRREEAVRVLADVFDVNPRVAKIRLGEVYPEADGAQLTL